MYIHYNMLWHICVCHMLNYIIIANDVKAKVVEHTHLCVVLVFREAATKQNIWLCVFTLEQESVHNLQSSIILSQKEKVTILSANRIKKKYMCYCEQCDYDMFNTPNHTPYYV